MDRYQRVEKPREESVIRENEIRITTRELIRNYITYATTLLQDKKEIVLKAMGQATSKAVAIAEIMKKRIPGLHQDIVISSTSITDVWGPIEEGLVPLEMTRHVSMISITLSMKEMNKNSPGYQSLAVIANRQHQRWQCQQRQKQAPAPTLEAPVAEDSYGQGGEIHTVEVETHIIEVGDDEGAGVEVTVTTKKMVDGTRVVDGDELGGARGAGGYTRGLMVMKGGGGGGGTKGVAMKRKEVVVMFESGGRGYEMYGGGGFGRDGGVSRRSRGGPGFAPGRGRVGRKGRGY